MARSADNPRKHASGPARTPLLEWVAGVVGLALVVAIVGLLAREALFGDNSPPDLRVRLVEVVPQGDGALVRIEVTNTGGRSAAQVAVEGVLVREGAPPETASVVLDYVPGDAKRKAGLRFSTTPRPDQLQLRAKGYVDP